MPKFLRLIATVIVLSGTKYATDKHFLYITHIMCEYTGIYFYKYFIFRVCTCTQYARMQVRSYRHIHTNSLNTYAIFEIGHA